MSWTRGGVACQIPREKTAQLCPTGGPSGSATLVLGAGRRKGTLIPVLGWWKAVAGEENEAEGTPPAASGRTWWASAGARTWLLVAVQGP